MKRLLVLLAIASLPIFAEGPDPLQETIKMLTNPAARSENLNTPQAQAADKAAGDVAGNPANKEKLYEISASLMQTLTQEAQGDPDKLQKLVEALQKDPASLEKKLTPAQRESVRSLSQDIEKKPTLH